MSSLEMSICIHDWKYTMTGFCIFGPIYDRVILKCRMKELRAGFSFLGKVLV